MENVLILGAGSDIGQSLGRVYASKGYSIWLAGRDLESHQILAKDLDIRHSNLSKAFYFEAGNFESHTSFVKNLPSLPDIVIYVIGYMGKKVPLDNDLIEIRKIIDSNYFGAISILNIFALEMKVRKSGTLIGVSSVAGERGRQSNFLYGSAKAGFSAYLSGLRNTLYPYGISVLTIKPGFMETSMTEDLNLPPLLTAQPIYVAETIYKAQTQGKNIVYIKASWRWIMMVIRNIPEGIFKKLSL